MKKQIICPDCDGSGVVIRESILGPGRGWEIICEKCNKIGLIDPYNEEQEE